MCKAFPYGRAFLLAVSHWPLAFTYPLRFARPPNLGGQYFSFLYSSPKLGEVTESQRGLSFWQLYFADQEDGI